MPVTYERRDAERLVAITVEGPFDAGEINDVMRRHAAEDTWAFATLWDLRAMSGRPSTDDLWSFSREYAHAPHDPERQRGPIAVVTDDDEMYRSACLYVVMSKPRLEIDVFRRLDEAEAWLADRLSER